MGKSRIPFPNQNTGLSVSYVKPQISPLSPTRFLYWKVCCPCIKVQVSFSRRCIRLPTSEPEMPLFHEALLAPILRQHASLPSVSCRYSIALPNNHQTCGSSDFLKARADESPGRFKGPPEIYYPKHDMILDEFSVFNFQKKKSPNDELRNPWCRAAYPLVGNGLNDCYDSGRPRSACDWQDGVAIAASPLLDDNVLPPSRRTCCGRFPRATGAFTIPRLWSLDQSSPPLLYLIRSVLLGLAKAAFTIEPHSWPGTFLQSSYSLQTSP